MNERPSSLDQEPLGSATYCGYVTLLGAPNSGKSTLLNALVGESLSSVTPKPQTTWRRVTGLRTTGAHQLIFLDTPGVLRPRDLLQRSLLAGAREAAREADVLLLVVDPVRPLDAVGRELLLEVAGEGSAPRIGVINKIDAAEPAAVQAEAGWLEEAAGAPPLPLSAATGTGVDLLIREIEDRLPAGPFLYPADDIASDPVRFFVAEMVRETIFEQYRKEIPYSAFCQVEEFRENEEPVYIQVTIYLERSSQKGILIGDKGSAIRRLGTVARGKIEHLLERPVYLDLWVKVLPGWRRKRAQLRRLGFTVPEDQS